MNVVIMGSGRFGATLANRLSREGHRVCIIDISPVPFRKYLESEFAGQTILGDGIDQDDIIAASGASLFPAPESIRADRTQYRGARLPYAKFPRNPAL